MIQLTRLNHGAPFFVNPDLVERVDTHVDTVVRLTSGTEFVVLESGEEIARRIAEYRARVLALAGLMRDAAHRGSEDWDTDAGHPIHPAALPGTTPVPPSSPPPQASPEQGDVPAGPGQVAADGTTSPWAPEAHLADADAPETGATTS